MSEIDLHGSDLVALVRGELSNEEVLATEDHLAGCASCREELVATVAGHSLLTRSAPTLVDLPRDPDRTSVPPFESVRSRQRPRLLLGAAAAAVLVAGIGLGAGATRVFDDSPDPVEPPESVRVSAVLEPVEGSGAGEVEMTASEDHSTRMTVRTTGLPAAPDGDFYYVWLLDPDTNKMLPLGLVEPGGTATFRLDQELLASYSAIDVSLEADDGDPQHSVTSVLRGTYNADDPTARDL